MNKRPLSLLTTAALLFGGLQVAPAAVSFVGITVPWIQGQTGELPNQTDGDTVPGNTGWNAYLRPVAGSFVNGGDEAGSLRFSLDLAPGEYTYEILLQTTSWVDDSVENPGSYLNLFFDGDRSNPAISAKLAGGNTGALEPLTPADIAQVVNDEGGFSAPAGSLVYNNGAEEVTLTALSMSAVGNEVGAFEALPSADGIADSRLTFTLVVIPEPSTSLLAMLGFAALAFRRRR